MVILHGPGVKTAKGGSHVGDPPFILPVSVIREKAWWPSSAARTAATWRLCRRLKALVMPRDKGFCDWRNDKSRRLETHRSGHSEDMWPASYAERFWDIS